MVRRKHTVQVQCSKCKRLFQSKASAHLCPACRPKKQQQQQPTQSQKPRPQRPPKPQRPPRPQNQRPPPMMPAFEAAASHESNSARIANRTSRSSAPLRPGKSTTSAIQRLVMNVIDPAGTVGQRAVRLNIDNIAAPKYPVQFDCNFTLQSDDQCRLLLASSPLISAVVWSPSNGVAIIGAESYTVEAPTGYYTYILGNKRNLITDPQGNLVVVSKEDFRQFRMIASSMQLQWSGQEIFKNGVYNIARITDAENLSTFNPNIKIDAVTCNISDVVVCTSQRATATTPLLPVDPNSEDAGGVRPDGGIKRANEYIVCTGGLPSSLDSGTASLGLANNSTFAGIATTYQGLMVAFYGANAEYKRIFDTFVSTLVAKYPNFYNSVNDTYSLDVKLELDTTVTIAVNTYKSVHIESKLPNSMIQVGAGSSFFSQLTSQLAAAVPGYIANIAVGTFPAVFTWNMILSIPIDGKVNQKVQVPNFLALGIDENSLADTVFYDNGFLEPVVQMSGLQMQVQVVTSHSFEFLLSDDTILAATAVANTPKDAEAVVNRADYAKFQKIMKGMPPALIMGDLGLARITATQMASRGILSDIKNVLGPIATAIFPNAAGIINTIGGVVDML